MAFNSLGINKETNHYEVIKISNIPWGISLNEIKCLLSNLMMPNQNQVVQAIHVMMNKSTGKTLSLAFVEVLSDKEETARTIRTLKRPPVKGRKLFFEQSSQHELMKELYPGWTTYFPSEGASVVSEDFQLQPGLIQRGEYESLLAVCRNFKLHFSRKCGERPFEHFISLLVKYPWDQPHIITTLQRDHLYEYYKQATAILRGHISKTHSTLDPTLLPRMIRGAIQSPGLTIPQKKGILTASASYCPSDLAHLLVQKPPETVSENEELLFVD
ncbi:hypothetical protein BDF14DRAFT_1501391 [Spinellus fusiger]|nr:hypothetical protein BDF14DRAFT_1501391 [Spinellus fusiger]